MPVSTTTVFIVAIACKGSVAPELRGGEEESQEETTCSESQFLFYGRQMSRLLQDHHSFQSCSDCSAVCRLFHGALPAYRRESSPYRRMLLQEETALG